MKASRERKEIRFTRTFATSLMEEEAPRRAASSMLFVSLYQLKEKQCVNIFLNSITDHRTKNYMTLIRNLLVKLFTCGENNDEVE